MKKLNCAQTSYSKWTQVGFRERFNPYKSQNSTFSLSCRNYYLGRRISLAWSFSPRTKRPVTTTCGSDFKLCCRKDEGRWQQRAVVLLSSFVNFRRCWQTAKNKSNVTQSYSGNLWHLTIPTPPEESRNQDGHSNSATFIDSSRQSKGHCLLAAVKMQSLSVLAQQLRGCPRWGYRQFLRLKRRMSSSRFFCETYEIGKRRCS